MTREEILTKLAGPAIESEIEYKIIEDETLYSVLDLIGGHLKIKHYIDEHLMTQEAKQTFLEIMMNIYVEADKYAYNEGHVTGFNDGWDEGYNEGQADAEAVK